MGYDNVMKVCNEVAPRNGDNRASLGFPLLSSDSFDHFLTKRLFIQVCARSLGETVVFEAKPYNGCKKAEPLDPKVSKLGGWLWKL
jgi:hypothetical protein